MLSFNFVFMKYIILATDDNFVQHCAVTITSVLEHNDGVYFFVLTEGLTNENIKILNELVVSYNSTIEFVTINSNLVANFPMPQSSGFSHISVATYYRLFMASLLPKYIDRVLYLDCDIVVRGNLTELFETDLEGFALGAVFQDDKILLQGDEYQRLGLSEEVGYFNAGVLLVNLKYWRDNNVEEQLLDYIVNHTADIKFHDQDTLNAVLASNTKTLDCKWNTLSIFLTKAIHDFSSPRCLKYKDQILSGTGRNPIVVHYVSRPKPWEWSCSHPYKNDYYYYLDKTVFCGWRPKWHGTKNELKDRWKNSMLLRNLPIFSKSGIFLKM